VSFQIVILVWLVLFVGGYLLLRKRWSRQLAVRRGKTPLDGVRSPTCPRCNDGRLEPQFKWWRYVFGIMVPPGVVVVLGAPDVEACDACGYSRSPVETHRLATRLSLTYRLRASFFLALTFYWVVGGILLYVYLTSSAG
jgi:hypothetical protein